MPQVGEKPELEWDLKENITLHPTLPYFFAKWTFSVLVQISIHFLGLRQWTQKPPAQGNFGGCWLFTTLEPCVRLSQSHIKTPRRQSARPSGRPIKYSQVSVWPWTPTLKSSEPSGIWEYQNTERDITAKLTKCSKRHCLRRLIMWFLPLR